MQNQKQMEQRKPNYKGCLGCGGHKDLFRFFCSKCITNQNFNPEDVDLFIESAEWREEMMQDALDSIEYEDYE